MKQILKTVRGVIFKSIHDATGKVSSSIIASYFILAYILFNATVYLAIDYINARVTWRQEKAYIIPYEHVVMFSLMLTHHLILLGIKSSKDKSILHSVIPNKQVEQFHVESRQEYTNDTEDPMLSGKNPS
jgi:hypothetical protein